jgi:hypothetical protein
MIDLATLTPDRLEPLVGAPFEVDGMAVRLDLARIDRFPDHPGAPRAAGFALLFVGPAQPILDQRIHRLTNEGLGTLEIFLVPLGPGPEGPARYEAVFN